MKNAVEAAQSERERFLAEVIENATTPFGVGAPDGSLVLFNRAFAELTGYSREELEQRRLTWSADLTPPEWREQESEILAKASRTGTSVRYQKEYLRQDGSRVPIELLVQPVLDSQGNLVHFRCFLTDISERKKVEESLRASEATLRGILNATTESIWLFSADGVTLAGNQTALDRWGPPETIIGKSVLEALPGELARSRMARIQEAVQSRRPVEFEDCRAGISFEHTFCPVPGADGRIDRIAVFSRDVTERRRAEEALRRFELLASHSRDIVLFIRRDDGRILEANAAAQTAYGYDREELLSLSIRDLRAPTTRPLTEEQMAIADGAGLLFETIHQSKDGNTFPVEVSSRGATIAGTRTLISVVRDITARKRTDAALHESHARTAAILESIADAFYSLDDQWRFVMVNPAAERAPFGRPASELLGKVIWDVFPRIVGTRIHQHYLDAVSKRSREHYEAPSPLNDRWYEVFMFPRAGGLDVYLRDIDDRKKVEEALRASEERFRKLASNAQDSITRFDREGRYVYLNPFAARLIGLPAEAVLGKTAQELGRNVGTDSWEARIREVFESGRPQRFDRKSVDGRWHDAQLIPEFRGAEVETVLASARDVTERKQAEAALRESEERFKAIADNTPDHILIQDRELRYCLVVNPQLGLREEDMVGKTDHDFLSREDADKLTALKRRVLETGDPMHLEMPLGVFEGRPQFFDGSYVPRRNAEGRIDGLIGYFKNVTERKQAELEVQAQRNLLDTVVSQLPMGVNLVRGRDLTYQIVNSAYLAIASKEVLGKSVSEVWPELHPWLSEAYRRVIETGEPHLRVDELIPIASSTGGPNEPRHFSWALHRVRLPGDEGWGVLNAVWETTERKQAEDALRESEQQFKRAHDELDQKVRERTAELEEANRILRMISSCNEVLVRATDEIDLVQSICKIIHDQGNYRMVWVGYSENDPARSVRPVASAGFEDGYLDSVKVTWADRDRGRGPTGTCIRTRAVRVCGNFLTDPTLLPWRDQAIKRGYQSSIALPLRSGGQVFGAVTLYSPAPDHFGASQVALLTELADDMSLGIMSLRAQVERDHARLVAERRAEQLKALASELTLAEQRERQRLAQLLHDGLQQLLVGAKFRIGALERAKGREVQRLAGELSDLISESIESSRSLTYELCPPILRQSGLLSALEWLARWMEDKHGLTVHLKASCEVAPASEEATILLFQATRELLFNVVKHSGVKAARVEVACEAGEVRILVADRGTGFNPQQIRAASDGGLGLLSLRERLELLGGRVEIDSAPGRGSRFTLVAPLPSPLQPKKPARTDDQPVMAVGVPSRREVPAGGKKTRVMLADDHVVMRQGLAELLRAEPDLEVVGEASDGASAVELIREVRPTVVIMDINMPGMTGIEATKVIHRQWPDVRVIGLSMFDEAEQAAAMRMAGAAGYCSKSAAPTSLIATIRACLKSGKHRPTTAAKKKARRAKPARRGRPRRPQ